MRGRDGCDFSFSGLKTKVRQTLESLPPGPFLDRDIADLCASFQLAAAEVLEDRCANGIAAFRAHCPKDGALVVAGGVAANAYLRDRLTALAAAYGLPFHAPPAYLCTDNGAMVAWAGLEQLRRRGADKTRRADR